MGDDLPGLVPSGPAVVHGQPPDLRGGHADRECAYAAEMRMHSGPRAASCMHAGHRCRLTVLALRMPFLLAELDRLESLECLVLNFCPVVFSFFFAMAAVGTGSCRRRCLKSPGRLVGPRA